MSKISKEFEDVRNDLFMSLAKPDTLELPVSQLRPLHSHLNVELTEECESIYIYIYSYNIEKLMDIQHSSLILPLNRQVFDEYVDYLTILRANSILIAYILIEATTYKTNCENSCRCFYNYLNPFVCLDKILTSEFSSVVEEGKMKGHAKGELVSVLCSDICSNENIIPDYINDYLSRSQCSVELHDNLPFLKNCIS